MVNDLKELMRQNVAVAPPDHLDVVTVVGAGRRRVRTRRRLAVAGAALVTAGVVALGAAVVPDHDDRATPASRPPAPDAPTITLADATRAAEGRDYRELASYTNEDLDADNGQYLDGLTDDGLILFRDSPRSDQLYPRFALMDPASGAKDWLPDLTGIGQDQTWPAVLGRDRLVLLSLENGLRGSMRAHVYDRTRARWTTMTWPRLPMVDFPRAVAGPDDRLYVLVPATQGRVPEGGWPTGPDGEADDADAEGDTYRLWSVSLDDADDVRDEGLSVGALAFTDTAMVWTDSSNGAAGLVHVRDLATGADSSFDPEMGARCNLLTFGAHGDRIVMGEYCGTYDQGRDDRVQIVTTDGDQVVTLQGNGIDGVLPDGSTVVNVSVYTDDDTSGTYVYDLTDDRLLRVSDGLSMWGLGGPTGDPRQFMWHTPVNHRRGATQYVGELLP